MEYLFRPFGDVLVDEGDIDRAEADLTSEVGNWFDKAKNTVEDFTEKTTDTIKEYSEKGVDKIKETYNGARSL